MIIGIMMNWFFGSWLVVPVATEVIESTAEAKAHEWTVKLKEKGQMSSE